VTSSTKQWQEGVRYVLSAGKAEGHYLLYNMMDDEKILKLWDEGEYDMLTDEELQRVYDLKMYELMGNKGGK